MLKAARAHGMPIMVIAMMTEAMTQPTAIHRPPNKIHSRFNSRESTDIVRLQAPHRTSSEPHGNVIRYDAVAPPDVGGLLRARPEPSTRCRSIVLMVASGRD